jgi:hypothetical protein
MGLRDRIRNAFKPAPVKVLEASIEKLRLGIFARLWKKYTAEYGDQSKFLSVAILNEAILETPSNAEAEMYLAANRALIATEAMKVHLDAELAEGLSYLYAAQILYSVWVTRSPLPDQSTKLAEKATELELYIPNTHDICGSSDANDCILAISQYAAKFLD